MKPKRTFWPTQYNLNNSLSEIEGKIKKKDLFWLLNVWKSLSLSDSLRPHGLYSPWTSPGQNTGVGSLSLLLGIFPAQALNPGLPHCRWILYQLSHQGSPGFWINSTSSLNPRCLRFLTHNMRFIFLRKEMILKQLVLNSTYMRYLK